jgi:hypothetical protein
MDDALHHFARTLPRPPCVIEGSIVGFGHDCVGSEVRRVELSHLGDGGLRGCSQEVGVWAGSVPGVLMQWECLAEMVVLPCWLRAQNV